MKSINSSKVDFSIVARPGSEPTFSGKIGNHRCEQTVPPAARVPNFFERSASKMIAFKSAVLKGFSGVASRLGMNGKTRYVSEHVKDVCSSIMKIKGIGQDQAPLKRSLDKFSEKFDDKNRWSDTDVDSGIRDCLRRMPEVDRKALESGLKALRIWDFGNPRRSMSLGQEQLLRDIDLKLTEGEDG